MTVQKAAGLFIKSPGKMTRQGRKAIAEWLTQQAKHLIKEGRNYTDGRYTASYRYTTKQ